MPRPTVNLVTVNPVTKDDDKRKPAAVAWTSSRLCSGILGCNYRHTSLKVVSDAALATTLEPLVGVLADLVIAPVIIPGTPLDHFTSPVTNPVSPATIQPTPALPATLATTLEPMVGVLAGLVIAPVIIPATLLDHSRETQ
jgi:hypothetical protein